jgi:PKD repeat protein
MKRILTIAIMLISFSIIAQNPCQDGTIIIDGKAIDAVSFENTNYTGLKLPMWLVAGTTLASGSRVHFISVIEFNEVNNAGNISLVYNKVIKVSTQTETVPSGKVWKVEAIVKHANAFASGFTASSNSPVCQGSTLNLSATTVAGTTYSWTGPNGFTSNVQNPVINNASQAAAGTYSMTATLNGCTSTASTTDVVVNALPVSTFTNSPSLIITNNNTTFTPTLSGASYSWVFDQGTPATSTAINPIVQWSNAGNYDVTLTVTDNNGCTSTTKQVVAVSNCTPGIPASDFTWLPSSPKAGQTVTFNPTTTGATYDWSFTGGSITTSTDENPDVIWSASGSYNVSLTVTDGNGCNSSTTQQINIIAPTTVTFNYTGSQQVFTVPSGVTNLTIEVWGASGCNHGSFVGGKGGYAKGDLVVTPSQTLYIYVGQQGIDASNSPTFGGGAGGDSNGGSGGGASDVRSGGNGLYDRVIVAGGGGGAWGTGTYPNWDGNGGDGGGLTGENATTLLASPTTGGMGGTQTTGGYKDGGFGVGGAGSYYGGGGGGWYGGGSADGSIAGAGGGGSGYIGGVTNGSMQSGVNNGNGKVTITY